MDPTKETVLDQTSKLGKHLWIVKPGENTNRGCGIQVSRELDHIKSLVSNTNVNGNPINLDNVPGVKIVSYSAYTTSEVNHVSK